ncbi:winged helix DNA-binding protein [Allopontixanthobacter sp.]|uniref:winged helix DNA-binding protein n=1 Tax=Allopontixanthobacter sp. TaxID=2906452 RepID=UPI002AB8B216|nr:winged helix DNA-binding protein [Allopontixanthobacter sp.]MDZ4307821.1 winged helix DNA-binding protein [Allopontixanthobacter sp.]
MGQADFHYRSDDPLLAVVRDGAKDPAGVPLAVSIFVDRAHLRETMCDDAAAAGFRLGAVGTLGDLLGNEARSLGEIVLLDCPVVDGATLAALARLDMRAARLGAHLVVSTTLGALDDVFGCLDQSDVNILVDPTRSERVIALGSILAKKPGMGVRELSPDDRINLLRLTEQVGQIAERLERLSGQGIAPGRGADGGAFRFESPDPDYSGPNSADSSERLVRTARPPLPDPRLVRRIIRQRQLRARFFDGELFADPAWDMLLDLTAARVEHTRVSITSLCIASGVPPTTALRWIAQMKDAGLIERLEDETDRRRAFISLTDKAADAMARYFAELGKDAKRVV